MPEYSAGEAKLRIVPDAKDFKSRLEADMSKIKAEFAINVTAHTAQARADIERFKETQRRDPIKVGVDVSLAEADAKMAAFRARQRANNVNVKVNADAGGALKTIGELDKQLDSVLGNLAKGLKLNLSIAGIGELPAASLAIADVAGAIQQLAQAGLAVPGILAGVVSSIGTLALGVSGIGDAYSAVTKASDDSFKGQTRSASTAARAQRELNDAYRDAKHQIEDLNLAARGDQISQQQAILNAQKARRQLQRDMASGSIKDQLDLQSDLLDIQAADQQVAETAQRNIENQEKLNQVNKDGIEGNERVVAAHEAVANAAEASGSATDAAARKMAELAPNAKDFAQTLVDLRPVFKDLQKDDANAIFDGLGKSLKDLVDADLPTVRTGIVGIGTAWNGTLKQLMTSLGSDSSKGFIERILGNTADAQTRAQQAIEPFVHALGTLTAAGSDALPRLADGFDRLVTRFDNFITEADRDGSLQRWIGEGLTAVSNLGDTILNLGKSFTAVTRALGGGEGLLGLLDKGSRKLADFLNSTEGQNKLKQWFEEGRREIQEHIIPLLQSLPGFFEGLYKAGRTIADTVVPPLKDIATFLAEHKRLVADVVVAFAAFKGISAIASLITDLQKISDLLGVGGTKGKNGKGGVGGKGILGKLALVTGGALLLDNIVNDDDTPKTDATPSTAAPSAVQPGDIPVGQPVPFNGVPGAGANRDTVTGLAPVAAGAAAGAAQAGPVGAVVGGALAIPGAAADAMRPIAPGSPAEAEANFNTIVETIPRITDDATLKQFADAFGLTPDQLKSMTRDDLHKRWVAIQSGQPLPPLPAGPAPKPIPLPPGSSGATPTVGGIPIPGLLPPAPPAAAAAPTYRPGEAQPGVSGYKPGVGWVDSTGKPTGYTGPPPPGFSGGGPTPSGRGNGPTGGHIIEAHGDEFVISQRGRASVPDSFLYQLNEGRLPKFEGGGPGDQMVDAFGNPVTPGPAPGAPVAPNPLAAGGGIGSIFNQFVSGLNGPISNLAGLAQAGASLAPGAGGSAVDPNTTVHGAAAGAAPGPAAGAATPDMGSVFASRLSQIPGVAGLIGSAMSPNPQVSLMNWGTKTADYVANWGMSTLGKLGSTLWSGALGIFGLQNSILSPTNPYFQAGQKGAQFALGQDGPLGTLLGMGNGGSDLPYAGDSNTVGAQTITLSDGTQVQIPTYATSVTPTGATAGGATASSPRGSSGGGAESWRPAVRAAIARYGPQLGITNTKAWEDALVRQIQTESSGNPGADNPNDTNGRGGSQHVSGLLQFLPSTFSANNISGGQYLDPNAQIAAALQYVMRRYGVGVDGSPNQIGRGVGYYSGGPTPSWAGPLDSKGGHLAVVHPDEFMISKRGRSTVPDSFLHALNQGMVDPKDLPGFEGGGEIPPPQGLAVVPPPRPNFQVPNAKTKVAPAPVRPTPTPAAVAPATPTPPATPQPPTTPAPQSTAPQQPEQATYQPGVPATAANPTDGNGMINHNIAAVDTLIKSTANTAATVASTAISMAGSMGAMGGGGAGAGAGAGLLGQFVGGVIQQGGKVADQIANVVSSSLVGNVPGSMGAPGARAYGQQLHAQQRVPVTAPDTGAAAGNGDTYNFNGMDVGKVFDQLELQRARDAQARNAKYGG